MVNQDRHQANQDQDGEPQDPWLEKFNARCDAMDKKLTDSYQQLDDHSLANAKLIALFDECDAKFQQLLHQSHRSKSHSSRSSSRSNHGSHHERHRQPHP
jgi:hypothetical protein